MENNICMRKNGNQHTIKHVMITPRVCAALRSRLMSMRARFFAKSAARLLVNRNDELRLLLLLFVVEMIVGDGDVSIVVRVVQLAVLP